MKKITPLLLTLFCCILFSTGAKFVTAKEVNGYVAPDGGSMVTCYSTYSECGVFTSCVTSIKCVNCSSQKMNTREDKGQCNNCGC